MAAVRKLGNIDPSRTVFFCCDLQERFRLGTPFFKDIVSVADRLIKGSEILDIPLIVTEQYPKGLGNTVKELDVSKAVGIFEKTKFSMLVPDVINMMQKLCGGDVQHVVLFGIEAHVCIQQTVIDLLERDIEVHVIADACTSRSQMDREFAYDRFRSVGADVTTSEAVLFQLCRDKEHPKFKEIQGLIKTCAPVSGLVKLPQISHY